MYLSRKEIREIIQKCLDYNIPLSEIKETVRIRDQREKDLVKGRYGF